jgi:hypothetical protein
MYSNSIKSIENINSVSNNSGPCLEWCFTYNRTYYILIGIVISLFAYKLYQKYQSSKTTKNTKTSSKIIK